MTALLDAPTTTETADPVLPVARRPRRYDRLGLAAVTTISLVLNTWQLTLNGLGNQYYTAATRSMITSWHNFFFVSYDPGGFISVDKPPVALWIEAASARLFGVSTWSILLPSAVAGAAAVALLWCTVRRRFGPAAATIAGAVLALSPVSVAVNRLNLPEPFMILFLVAAAWAVLRSFDTDRWLRWILLAGACVGLAFNTKMLAAYIPVPALGLAVLIGTRGGWWPRLKRTLIFGLAIVAVSLPWIMAVDLTPASSRPYVGGSTNNTEWNLVFGYNGLGRVDDNTAGGPGGGARIGGGQGFGGGVPMGASGASGTGGIIAGTAGPTRLFGDALGGQIAWLLPMAAVGALAALWRHRRHARRAAAIILWGGWLALYAVVFSYAQGTFHAYYTAAMAPALAALVGIGLVQLVALARANRVWLVALAGALVVSVDLELTISGHAPQFYGWIRPLFVIGAAAAIVMLAVALLSHGLARTVSRLMAVGAAVGLSALLLAPSAWALSEAANPVLNATLPQAGPRTGASGSSFGSANSNGDPALAAYLLRVNHGETWDVAVASAQVGSGLLADQGVSVMSLGGFMGSDPAATVDSIAAAVAKGSVRYFLVSNVGMGGAGGAGSASAILSKVSQVCAPVTTASTNAEVPASYSGLLYDCAGKSARLAA